MQAKEAGWYDEFYKQVQTRMAPWYQFLMPDLLPELRSDSRLIELGCGQGHILRLLTGHSPILEENIYGIDQSAVAVEFTRGLLPKAHISTQDIYQMDFPRDHFDVCLLMETIEHLEAPVLALQKIREVIAPGGILYASFPNYLSLPWLPVRILAEKLNTPWSRNWVVLQPVDKIYTTFHVRKLAAAAGFTFEKGIGSGYGPPVLYRAEKEWMTKSLNALGLWHLSFHPVLKFRKPV
ncbi:MAG TPA: class I SAM-dependent methyltransferase [Methylomirabilota bacterium]|nr:class I SAM-dependent methyltransferase [Methylomirabilota bacterium]